MKCLHRLCVVIVPILLLSACASTRDALPPEETPPTDERPARLEPSRSGDAFSGGAEAMPAPVPSGFEGSPLDDPDSLLSERVIYFDFDRADVNPEQREIIEAHAAYLAEHRDARVVLEGHTDERGSREYNMGLGERRANAVRSLLTLNGAPGSRVEVVSFGEERPVAMGQDEGSWRLNRRVEIVYR